MAIKNFVIFIGIYKKVLSKSGCPELCSLTEYHKRPNQSILDTVCTVRIVTDVFVVYVMMV